MVWATASHNGMSKAEVLSYICIGSWAKRDLIATILIANVLQRASSASSTFSRLSPNSFQVPLIRRYPSYDHFAQRGPHGVHYCLLIPPLRPHVVHAFRASASTDVHIVKPITACVVEDLKALHALDIIHANVKADSVSYLDPNTMEIEETIAKQSCTFGFEGGQYPILRSQLFLPKISWGASPFASETIQVVLNDLGAGMRVSVPLNLPKRWRANGPKHSV